MEGVFLGSEALAGGAFTGSEPRTFHTRVLRGVDRVSDLVGPGTESPRGSWLRMVLIHRGYRRPITQISVQAPTVPMRTCPRTYCFFSAWPPNSLRLADRIWSVNSASPRVSNPSHSEAVLTGARTPASPATTPVHDASLVALPSLPPSSRPVGGVYA